MRIFELRKHAVAILMLFLTFSAYKSAKAEYVLSVAGGEVPAQETIVIDIEIDNSGMFIAFQVDVPIPDQFSYVSGSAALNPERITNHLLQAQLVQGNILRLISFSFTNASYLGYSGSVVSFELTAGTQPGAYSLTPVNPIISSPEGQNVVNDAIAGVATILGPDINMSDDFLDFGHIPLQTHHNMSLFMQNTGNQPLEVFNVTFDSPFFELLDETDFTVLPWDFKELVVQFSAVEKGHYSQQMTIFSNNPGEPELTVNLQATAFAVNELHCNDMFSFSGDKDTLSLSINNMEGFVSFQFDIQLPSPLSYVPGSAFLTDRKTDHQVMADMISDDTLRVLAFSMSLDDFLGEDGEIVKLVFDVMGTGGWYPLNLFNVIIADSSAENILSATGNGSLEVAAPNIYSVESVSFGDVSVLDSGLQSLRIYNHGSDLLVIDDIQTTDNSFFTDQHLPIHIEAGDFIDIEIFFQSAEKGLYEAQLQIYSNDPEKNPYNVTLIANAFVPNYMMVEDTGAALESSTQINILVENIESFVAFDFKIHYPDDVLTFLPGPAHTHLTERAGDHILAAGVIGPGVLRAFAYSLNEETFAGNEGAIVKLGFEVIADEADVTHTLELENAILANAEQENILYQSHNGLLHILDPVTCRDDDELCIDAEAFFLIGSTPEGGTYYGPGVTGEVFDPGLAGDGIHEVIYSYEFPNGFSAQCSFFLTVNPLPDLTCPANFSIYQGTSAFILDGATPAGGVYEGDGVTDNDFFNPMSAGAGEHIISYFYIDENGCSNECSFVITVHTIVDLACPADFTTTMADDPFQLSGATPEGGLYSGPGVDDYGVFHPSVAGTGIHTIQYAYTDDDTGSSGYCQFTITVLDFFTIMATAEENGNINPAGMIQVLEGDDLDFTISANDGFRIHDVLVNGISVGAISSFLFEEVSENHSIHATFAINTYLISAVANNDTYGTVYGGGTYEHFQTITLTAAPFDGYQFINWTENSDVVFYGDEPAGETYVFIATQDRNLVANFSQSAIDDTLLLSDMVIGDGPALCYDALLTITVSDFAVVAGGSTTLIAGQSIHLLPGTVVENGGHLLARIAQHANDYCGMPKAIEITKELVTSKEGEVVSADFPFEVRKNGFFKLFPNPTDGTFTLELTTVELEQNITVEVHSMLGGRLFIKELPPQRLHTLSLEGKQPGMYIIRVMKGDKVGVERLIKQ